MAAVFRQLCLLVLTEACYDEFFVKFNFLDVPCLRAAVSKGLGLAIVGGSILVKVPQILKIVKAKSGEGISIIGTSLELAAITFNVAYNVVNRYPFSAYGDGVFLLLQTAIIGALVFLYGGAPQKAALFFLTIMTVALTLSSGLVPIKFLWVLQASNIPIVFAGKMVQAVANFKNSSTGQLSAVTVMMLFLGSMARIFTSIQETGDPIIILTYSVATFANGVLMVQVLYYWNAPATKTKKGKGGKSKRE
ncbi:mannose-P-dolichol utilization defect 1 protein homolog [Eriocheir sinensis]|uniref:mannose-P-dolichol utilization defect 1 protein homolog n=1 Tax=Eriocheir sinensis TaxID=95602 RepID=UPI0021C7BC19|nr:mannose-P-dolichol utilization defect 1 protein homolog [Eriocheir sinensis]